MPEAIAIVNRFLDSGVILRTVTRREAIDTFVATAEGTDTRTPLAVLINGGSASSSEIVAGCLQDRGRAIVVGERSFGKGSVQKFFNLDGGGGVKLTVAHYQLPGGRIIHRTPRNTSSDDWGIIPDIVVPTDGAHVGERDPQLAAAIQALERLTR
jgi:carboxyl-terminal processing protease